MNSAVVLQNGSWETLISSCVAYESCSLVNTALEFSSCSAQVRYLSDCAMLGLNFRLAKICQNTFCSRLLIYCRFTIFN